MRNVIPGLPIPPSPIQLWSVEDDSVQFSWGRLPPGQVTAWCHHRHTVLDHPGGPGVMVIDGLSPDTDYQFDLTWNAGSVSLAAHTPPPPPGRPLTRIATVSDLHLGSVHWGATKTMVDRSGHRIPAPYRCARSAITDALDWGAELLIIKGDAVHHQDTAHFDQLAQLVDEFAELPIMLLPGNHDVDDPGGHAPLAPLGERQLNYVAATETAHLDGITVIGANTTVPGRGPGTLGPIAEAICQAASDSSQPVLVALHHHLQRWPIPTYYPLGISGSEANPFLHSLGRANHRALVTSGHTHRIRRRDHGPVVVTEVASTRDWPGVWAGYKIHEGGISQIVRRVSGPEAIGWHEYSRRALLGWWGPWAAGPVNQRGFVHPWP